MPRHRIIFWLDASRNHSHSLDPGSGPQRAVRQKIVARDDGVGQANGRFESSLPPGAMRPATIIGIAIRHGVIEIENQMPRSLAQNAKLPARQQFAFEDHRVILRRPVELQRPPQSPAPKADTCQRPTGSRGVLAQMPGFDSGNRHGREILPTRANSSRPP